MTPQPPRETDAPPPDVTVAGLSNLRPLARGGYSTVYRAWQRSVERDVALKVDHRRLDSPADQQRFLREAGAAGRMSGHPSIVHVYDAGVTSDDHPYLVMELCTGGSYADKLTGGEQLSVQQVRDVGIKIADALDAAHRAGILHRDVKPANILLNRYGLAGLADFGLAVVRDASKDGVIPMDSLTPAYAAPEVFRLAPPTEAVDIYSLGATLYALLAGKPPRWPDRGSVSPAQLVALHRQPLPPLPHCGEEFFAVLTTAMATRPADRFSSAAAMRDELIALPTELGPAAAVAPEPTAGAGPGTGLAPVAAPPELAGVPHNFAERSALEPSPDSATPSPSKRRSRWLTAALSVTLLCVVITGGFLAARDDDTADIARPSSEVDCVIATPRVQCVPRPECFSALGSTAADYSAATVVDCRSAHRWETFAIAELPADAGSVGYVGLRGHPYVTALCSQQTLRRLTDSAQEWQTAALLPSASVFAAAQDEEAKAQLRFRCVAGTDESRTTSSFSR